MVDNNAPIKKLNKQAESLMEIIRMQGLDANQELRLNRIIKTINSDRSRVEIANEIKQLALHLHDEISNEKEENAMEHLIVIWILFWNKYLKI